jgi:hypothetical protein
VSNKKTTPAGQQLKTMYDINSKVIACTKGKKERQGKANAVNSKVIVCLVPFFAHSAQHPIDNSCNNRLLLLQQRAVYSRLEHEHEPPQDHHRAIMSKKRGENLQTKH